MPADAGKTPGGRRALRGVAGAAPVLLALALLCAPARAAAPVEELRALHQKVLRAHREGKVELLMEDEAPDYVVANRGEITRPSLAERRSRFGAYFGTTAFSEYRDLVDPVITASADGTLGWVVVQVTATGVQTSADGAQEPLQFVSAWIELYQKRAGRWWRTGNVSNFKP